FVEFPVKKSLPQDYLRLDRNYGTVKLDYRRFTLEELSLILSRFGTFLNFSRTETFSYTSVEAISRGLRVMTDRRGPLRSYIRQPCVCFCQRTGILDLTRRGVPTGKLANLKFWKFSRMHER